MGREAYQALVANAQKIVVKVGTSTLTHKNGKLNLEQIEKLVRQLSDLRNQGKDVVLVSSGAIGAGMGKLNLEERPKTIPEKQAVAAVGQGILLHIYEKIFSEYGQATAQLLLTKADLEHRQRFLNARNTLLTLLRLGVIPIVNENDSVATEEIVYGDNDSLSAIVARLVKADALIILSDIDGLFDDNPNENPDARLIPVIREINDEIRSLCGAAGTDRGTGGMVTKIHAAEIATGANIPTVIMNGEAPQDIYKLIDGHSIGTIFLCKEA